MKEASAAENMKTVPVLPRQEEERDNRDVLE